MSFNRGWLDLETTGFTELDKRMVYQHRILEFGAAVTDADFNVIASMNVVVHQRFQDYSHLLAQKVLDMHIANGLFAECERSVITLDEAESQVINFYRKHGIEHKDSPMSGNGITFDRIFTEAHLPRLNNFLTYRQLDVSSVKEFLKVIMPGVEPVKKQTHRALDDILESIAEARHYRQIILNSAGKP
jgi:oligoribonuclease